MIKMIECMLNKIMYTVKKLVITNQNHMNNKNWKIIILEK